MTCLRCTPIFFLLWLALISPCCVAQEKPDYLRQLQFEAANSKSANWVHWGDNPSKWSNWTNHSNRLVPVYSFGIKLDSVKGENSVYRSGEKLKQIYDEIPESTLNPEADYFDQTDIYRLQCDAIGNGKKNFVLIVFDGMDWQTTQAASAYKNKKLLYEKGRGSGLSFLDYGVKNGVSDFGYMVVSAHNSGTKKDVNAQTVYDERSGAKGGYSWELGGSTPWAKSPNVTYLLGKQRDLRHVVTDSAASATSMTAGIKTFNGAINIDPDGKQVQPIGRKLQKLGYAVGVVSSVPFNHATPACAYANNVSRSDYQDIARDMLGVPSISHREGLPGMDVIIGGGWGEKKMDDRSKQGNNFVPGNSYVSEEDLKKIDVVHGGQYVIAQRTEGSTGSEVLAAATKSALDGNHRLFGLFGAAKGHLPYQTADGEYDPTRGVREADVYTENDISENPTLEEMTEAALSILSRNEKGFWLMVEAGDVDWANHNNNVDDSIGAVFSGDAAFDVVTKWVEENSSWQETAVIVTADHGHMMIVDDFRAITGHRKTEKTETTSQSK